MSKYIRLKPLEEMDLIDDFLNNAVASNKTFGEEIFRIILEVLLEKKIGPIGIQNQVVLSPASQEMRGVRLDVEIKEHDEGGSLVTVYDYEPHTQNDTDFPKSNRYRLAKIDSRNMAAGDRDFSHMPEVYIITITNFDVFGLEHMVYTAETIIKEAPEVEYNDGVKLLYFNTSGTVGGSTAIKNMLTYISKSNSGNAVDDATRQVDSLVSRIKDLEEVRTGYMTVGDKLDYLMALYKDEILAEAKEEAIAAGRDIGLEEGRAAGIKEGLEEGRAAGIKEGLEEGRAAGIKEGLEEGRAAGIEEGRAAERENTLRETKRANDAEAELERLREKLKSLEATSGK